MFQISWIIDKELSKIKIKEYDVWGNHIFRKRKYYKIPNFDMKKDYEDIILNLKKFDFKSFKKGYIHGDLHESNILVKNGSIQSIIDWDDCHNDYYAYELAIFISFCLFSKNGFRKELIKEVVFEYEKFVKLSANEKDSLYYLIKHRFLSLILWSKKHKLDKSKWFDKKVQGYQDFCKISFEEFKDLLK